MQDRSRWIGRVGYGLGSTGISDLVIGNIIDNTESKLGKARVWLLRMCLPLVVTLFLLFRVPDEWPDLTKYIYVFIMYNLLNTVICTFMQIAHFTLFTFFFDRSDRRKNA